MRFALLGIVFVLVVVRGAEAETYAVIEQDTHHIVVVDVDTISSPSGTTRRFKSIYIDAWPELWQGEYTQIIEGNTEVDCWNHKITFDGKSIRRDIKGEDTGQSIGDPVVWPISDGYEPYEKFVCDHRVTVNVTPFKSIKDVKEYYFDWLNKNVPIVVAQ